MILEVLFLDLYIYILLYYSIYSSTSWTEDEDFGLFFQALLLLDAKIQDNFTYPNILVVVTGKGPQKAMYLQKIAAMDFKRIRILTM